MTTMKAKIPFTYAGVALKKGAEFDVKTANDVNILTALGNAEVAPAKKVKEVEKEVETEPETRSHKKKEVEDPKRTYKRRDMESE